MEHRKPTRRERHVRFALMIEAQQGLTYDEQLAVVRRAEAAGFESFFRSDHYQSFPGRPGTGQTDAWGGPRRLARDTARGSGSGSWSRRSPSATPANLAKVATTVDVRCGRTDRVRTRRGLERRGAPPSRAAVPTDQRASGPPRGQPRDPPRALGQPDGMVVSGKVLKIEGAQFYPSRSTCPAGRGCRTAPLGRGFSSVAGARRGRWRHGCALADEFNLSSSTPDQARGKYAALAAACEAIEKGPATMTRSLRPASCWAATQPSSIGGSGTCSRLRRRRRRRGLDRCPRARWCLAPGDGRAMVVGSRRPARSGSCPGLPARDLEMIDLLAEALSSRRCIGHPGVGVSAVLLAHAPQGALAPVLGRRLA